MLPNPFLLSLGLAIKLRLPSKLVSEFQPDIILAIGGGTVLDLAKLSNVFCTIQFDKKKLKNIFFK